MEEEIRLFETGSTDTGKADEKNAPKKKKTVFGILAIVSAVIGVFVSVVSFLAGLIFVGVSVLLLILFLKGGNKKAAKIIIAVIVGILLLLALLLGLVASFAKLPEPDTSSSFSQSITDSDVKKAAEKEANRKYIEYIMDSSYTVTVDVTSVSHNGDQYTAYGKVTIVDPYKDRYTGRFNVVFEDRNNELIKLSEEFEAPKK